MYKQQVILTDYNNTMGSELKCPTCSESYLHQRDVTVFQRYEDQPKTIVMQQSEDNMIVTTFPSEDTCNPSPRRHGLLIEFECEHCHYTHVDGEGDEHPREPLHRLAIYQHKGITFVEWQIG